MPSSPPDASKASTDQSHKMTVPPSDALMELLSPDGYYSYLGIVKPNTNNNINDTTKTTTSSKIDEELVKKNYRRLSLKHHPDRPGGDAETFHALNRAQTVLMNSKLREQYDLLGLDLDEEEVDESHSHGSNNNDKEEDNNNATKTTTTNGSSSAKEPTAADSIVSHIFTAALTAVLQLAVRTVMMGVVAVLVCRYRFTVYPALAILAFIAYRLHLIAKAAHPSSASNRDLVSPALIGLGLVLMHQGRALPDKTWSWMFWMGEALVMTMFTYNSLPPEKTPSVLVLIAVAALVLTLWLRGNVWKYLTIVGLEAFLALVLAIAFPMMEMVLEEIVKEKLRKVGDKVRAHAQRVQVYYANKR